VNEETFLSALRDDPSDEVTWLALADYFDDSGQPARAELLRLTRRLRAMPLDQRDGVRVRVVALLRAGVRPVVVERVNSIGMRFALVPPGRFLMGAPAHEPGRNDDEHPHEVILTRPFWLGVFPVTQRQWRQLTGNNSSLFSPTGFCRDEVEGMSTDDFPVDSTSYNEVQAFLTNLKALPAEAALGWPYRLPSEAEWEYACRGGGFPEPFCLAAPSASLAGGQANFESESPTAGTDPAPSLKRTSTVGSYEPNPLGLFDMHGNVWEWCHDWYGDSYYYHSPPRDPTGPAEGERRAQHGGSWDSGARYCRAAHRARVMPDDADAGFRVAFFHEVSS